MNKQEEKTVESMLISVGGAPAPIIKSIEENKPQRIIFFTSQGSYNSVTQDILPEINKIIGIIPLHEIVVTPDFQDVGESAFSLLQNVPIALTKLGSKLNWPEIVDYTGGTKSMSAAMVWASSRFSCQFSYIGSDAPASRTKGGLGVVVNGNEKCLIRENPWNAIAYYDVRHAVTLFNNGMYSNAVAALQSVIEKVTHPDRMRVLLLVQQIWTAYQAWDNFDHLTAIKKFNNTAQSLLDIAPQEEVLWQGITLFSEKSLECFNSLKDIITGNPNELTYGKIYDLQANALRRAELEHKYEDATARCYAAVEKYGKYVLKRKYDIDNSNCRLEQIPESLYVEYKNKYSSADQSDYLRFGLQATFTLLAELGNTVGTRYLELKNELEKLLALRNNSILGHGSVPINKENFNKLFNVSLQLMDIEKSELTKFPQFLTCT